MGEFCENLDTPVYIGGGDGEVLETTVGGIMPYPFLKFEGRGVAKTDSEKVKMPEICDIVWAAGFRLFHLIGNFSPLGRGSARFSQ